MGDGRSTGGERSTWLRIYNPFCSLAEDSAAQPVDVCGPPFGDFRARTQPLRREAEWQLNDLDLAETWRQVDEEALDNCNPYEMLAPARDVVSTSGRWPSVLSSCECPQERRLEARLALIFNAYVAKPYSTHPAKEFFAAIACKKKLQELRKGFNFVTSAAQPGLTHAATHSIESVSAAQPDAVSALRWRCKLHEWSLQVKAVEGDDVFSHTPSKSILKEDLQRQVLRKFGVYKSHYTFCDVTKPWDRFFMFDRDFVAYNRAGMRAEDPNAHKWSASKLWIDYTPYVSSKDWTKALLLRIQRDDENIQNLLRERKRRQASSPSSCTCGRVLRLLDACECQSHDIQARNFLDIINVDALPFRLGCSIWDWFVGEHSHDAAKSVLRDVRAALTGTWLQRRLQFYKAIVAEAGPRSHPSTQIWIFGDSFSESTKYEKYLLHDSAHCFFALEFPGHEMPLLFWAGGTYARRPEDFPQEQSSAAWLEQHMLPLYIEAPGFRRHDSLEGLAKTWSLAKWHGQAPHPFAIKEPFPYATTSMRAYCDDYVDAAWCRGSPWCSSSR